MGGSSAVGLRLGMVRVDIRPADGTIYVHVQSDLLYAKLYSKFIGTSSGTGDKDLTVPPVSYSRIISVVRTVFGNERAGLTTGGLLPVGGKIFFALRFVQSGSGTH